MLLREAAYLLAISTSINCTPGDSLPLMMSSRKRWPIKSTIDRSTASAFMYLLTLPLYTSRMHAMIPLVSRDFGRLPTFQRRRGQLVYLYAKRSEERRVG